MAAKLNGTMCIHFTFKTVKDEIILEKCYNTVGLAGSHINKLHDTLKEDIPIVYLDRRNSMRKSLFMKSSNNKNIKITNITNCN